MGKNIHAMNKTEVVQELTARKVPFSARETLPELRFKLSEARKRDGDGMTSHEVRKEHDPMYGLASMKLAGLVLKCHELGLLATSKDSKGGLLAKLRTYYEGEEGSFDPKAPLTWSRFAGRTPENLALNEPDFIDWRLVTAREPKVSPQLARLVEWAEQERAAGESPAAAGAQARPRCPFARDWRRWNHQR